MITRMRYRHILTIRLLVSLVKQPFLNLYASVCKFE